MKLFRAVACGIVSLMLSGVALSAWDLTIKLDRQDGLYKPGENVTFTIQTSGSDIPDAKFKAVMSMDNVKKISEKSFALKEGATLTGTLDSPGFLSVAVDTYVAGKRLKKIKGAAFSPEKITQGAPMPADFKKFWDDALAEAAKTPLDAKVTLLPKYSVEGKYKSYAVSLAAPGGRVYGFLTIPESPTPVPALVMLPASGSDRSAPVVNQFGNKFAILYMNIMDIDPLSEQAGLIRRRLQKKYPTMNSGNRKDYFFYRPVVGFCRAVDFLCQRKEIDKNRIAAFGTSQGGGMSLVVAALNKNIKAVVADVPALCDHHAAAQGRRAGWPRLINPRVAGSEETAKYFDVANFCRFVNVPVWVIVGFEDDTCPPGSVYAAFNAIPASGKQIINEVNKGHSNSASYGNCVGKMRTYLLRLK